MTANERVKTYLENMVLEQSSDQLLYLRSRATELQLNNEEYLDYLTCYLKKVLI